MKLNGPNRKFSLRRPSNRVHGFPAALSLSLPPSLAFFQRSVANAGGVPGLPFVKYLPLPPPPLLEPLNVHPPLGSAPDAKHFPGHCLFMAVSPFLLQILPLSSCLIVKNRFFSALLACDFLICVSWEVFGLQLLQDRPFGFLIPSLLVFVR